LQFLWTPYRQAHVSRMIIINVSPIIRALVSLICFATIKFHQVDRVVRQFGWRQSIPADLMNLDEVRGIDLRGRGEINWRQYHHRFIMLWNNRHNFVVQGGPFSKSGHLHDNFPFMQWYINHTICYISPIAQSSDDEVRIIYFMHIFKFNFLLLLIFTHILNY